MKALIATLEYFRSGPRGRVMDTKTPIVSNTRGAAIIPWFAPFFRGVLGDEDLCPLRRAFHGTRRRSPRRRNTGVRRARHDHVCRDRGRIAAARPQRPGAGLHALLCDAGIDR